MYTKHIIPSYNSCISLSGTLRHTTAVYFALRKRHTTLCMRFSSSTSPFPHVPQHRSYCTRSTFPTLRNMILGLCTHIRRTLLALGTALGTSTHTHRIHRNLYSSSPLALAPTITGNQHLTIYSALTDPTIEAPVGTSRGIFLYRMRFRLTTSYNPTLRRCHQHALRAYILYIGNTPLKLSI